MCDQSAWFEGVYLVFVFTLAQVFLAMRCVQWSTSCLIIVFGRRLNVMKGVCADYAQETGAVGVFCTYSGLRRDGIIHGFLAADERYVYFRSRRRRFFIPDRCSFCLAIEMLDIPLPAFHICVLNAPLWTEWAYVAGVGICGESSPSTTEFSHHRLRI